MAVHSARLAATANQGTSETTVYTVPAGIRTIVKCVVCFNAASAANRLAIKAYSGSTLLFQWTMATTALGTSGETAIALPWIVLNAGEHLTLTADASFVRVAISGTELQT